MKKLISLVLSLVLCLTAVSAFAQSSPTNVEPGAKPAEVTVEAELVWEDTSVTELTEEQEGMKIAAELVVAGAMLLDPNALVGEDAGVVIPENFRTILSESTVHKFTVGDAYKDTLDTLTLVYSFQTKYNEGETVYVLLAILDDTDEEGDEFYILEGKANADGDVVVTFDEKIIKALDGKLYIPFAISEDGIVRE